MSWPANFKNVTAASWLGILLTIQIRKATRTKSGCPFVLSVIRTDISTIRVVVYNTTQRNHAIRIHCVIIIANSDKHVTYAIMIKSFWFEMSPKCWTHKTDVIYFSIDVPRKNWDAQLSLSPSRQALFWIPTEKLRSCIRETNFFFAYYEYRMSNITREIDLVLNETSKSTEVQWKFNFDILLIKYFPLAQCSKWKGGKSCRLYCFQIQSLLAFTLPQIKSAAVSYFVYAFPFDFIFMFLRGKLHFNS